MFQLVQQNKSCWYIGRSRTGKSTALIQKCRSLAEQGHGAGLLDPHRTTAFDVLPALEGIASDRTAFFDFDAADPVAYHPFDNPDEDDYGRLTTEYVHSFTHLFDATGFHRMAHLLGMAELRKSDYHQQLGRKMCAAFAGFCRPS